MKTIYEDEEWTIQKVDNDIRITLFKNNHFVDDITLHKEDFFNDKMDLIKVILYE